MVKRGRGIFGSTTGGSQCCILWGCDDGNSLDWNNVWDDDDDDNATNKMLSLMGIENCCNLNSAAPLAGCF